MLKVSDNRDREILFSWRDPAIGLYIPQDSLSRRLADELPVRASEWIRKQCEGEICNVSDSLSRFYMQEMCEIFDKEAYVVFFEKESDMVTVKMMFDDTENVTMSKESVDQVIEKMLDELNGQVEQFARRKKK